MKHALYFVAAALVGLNVFGCAQTPKLFQPWFSQPSEKGDFDRRLSLARLSERHGQVKNATQIYRRILSEDPSDATAHHRLGVIAAQEKRHDEAMKHFEMAEQSAPQNAEILNDIGFAFYLRNDLTGAESKLRAALAIDPQHQGARNNLGIVLGEQGRLNDSLAEFRQAVGEAGAHTNLAYVRARRGDLDGAKADYHRALDLEPSLRPAAEALVQLESATGRTKVSNQAVPKVGKRMNIADVNSARYPARPVPSFDPGKLRTSHLPAKFDEGTGRHVIHADYAERSIDRPNQETNRSAIRSNDIGSNHLRSPNTKQNSRADANLKRESEDTNSINHNNRRPNQFSGVRRPHLLRPDDHGGRSPLKGPVKSLLQSDASELQLNGSSMSTPLSKIFSTSK